MNGTTISFVDLNWESDVKTTTPRTLTVFDQIEVGYDQAVKFNRKFYNSRYSIGEEMKNGCVAGDDDDPAGYGSGEYTLFFCHAEGTRTRSVCLLIEWEPDYRGELVREMWIQSGRKWESIITDYVRGGGRDVKIVRHN